MEARIVIVPEALGCDDRNRRQALRIRVRFRLPGWTAGARRSGRKICRRLPPRFRIDSNKASI